MPKLSGKDLSSLYPKPKPYDELRGEQRLRMLARQPRNIAVKISLYATSTLVVVLAGYWLIYHMIVGSLSSAGAVISGASLAVGLVGLIIATLFYIYSLIRNVADTTFLSSMPLYIALGSTLFVSSIILTMIARFWSINAVAILVTLVFNIVVSLASTIIIKSHQD